MKPIVVPILALIALHGMGQTPARTPPRAKIICSECPKPAADAVAPFEARKTLLGQHLDVVLPQLTHQAGVRPIIIQTPRGTIAAAVEGSAPDDLSFVEVEYMTAVFPGFKPGATLDAHQEAHLLAHRFRQIEKDLADLLELDADGRVKQPESGPESAPTRPVSSSHVEILVFSKPAGYQTFTSFQFEPGIRPFVGTELESGPTGAVLMPGLKEPGARCLFVFSSSLQILAGLSKSGNGLQGWLRLGLARFMEDRHAPKAVRSPLVGPTPAGFQAPADWTAFVADLITDGKTGDLGALAATPVTGLSFRSEAQSLSMVRWMIEKDQAKFAAMVRRLLHAPPGDSPPKALVEAVRPTLGHDLVSLVDAWKDAVKKSRVATK